MRAVHVFIGCIIFYLVCAFTNVSQVQAGSVLGIHILSVGELDKAKQLLKTDSNKDEWVYVTIPITLNDLSKKNEWQHFFDQAKQDKFIPIVRLTTSYNSQKQSWEVPTHKNIVDMSNFLSSLSWPKEDEKLIVVFNEPNHAKEWGGTVNPQEYARILAFTSEWFHSDDEKFIILPAGMDLAAPNSNQTMEAFTYMRNMVAEVSDVFASIDAWNSHSYPNPGFSASPYAQGKNSLRGFEYELSFLKKYITKQLPVYITETGWVETKKTQNWLSQYYMYAMKHIWSDDQVKAVTPFVLNGSPGTFSEFSFYDEKGNPTKQFYALRKVIEELL